jgi:hypothetical protein
MNTPDIEMVLRAVADARRILGEYIEPGRMRDPAATLDCPLAASQGQGTNKQEAPTRLRARRESLSGKAFHEGRIEKSGRRLLFPSFWYAAHAARKSEGHTPDSRC